MCTAFIFVSIRLSSLSKSVSAKFPNVPKPALFIRMSTSFTLEYSSLQFSSFAKSIAIISLFPFSSLFVSSNLSLSLETNTKSYPKLIEYLCHISSYS